MQTPDDFDDPHDGFLAALWLAGTTKLRPHGKRLTLVLGAAMLVILGGIVWMSARHHHPGAVVTADAIPLVQAPATPWRTKPTDPGGMEIPYRDSTVFNALQPPAGAKVDAPPDVSPTIAGGDKIENLLATSVPLVPKAKLFPEQKTATDNTAGDTPAATAPPQSIVGVETADADDFVPDDNGKHEAATPASPSVTTAAGGYYVQLGAVASAMAAQASWKRAQTAYPELSDLSLHVEPVTAPHGTLYRVQAGPVDQAHAHALCAAVMAKKPGGCIVVKH